MADISIDFHATEHEIANWLLEWLTMEKVTLVLMVFEPFSVKEIEFKQVTDIACSHDVKRLLLFASEPNLNVKNKVEFDRSNHDELVLDIGHLSEQGLGESWLACRTENPDALKKWRHIAKHLRANTRAGVTGISRQNGVAAFYRSHRYSQGAKDLEEAGTPILPCQGSNGPIIRLGKINEE